MLALLNASKSVPKAKTQNILIGIIVLVLLLIPLTGCSEKTDENLLPSGTETSALPPAVVESSPPSNTESSFAYSDDIDENGFWQGVVAIDYVDLCEYNSVAIPSSVHTIPDEKVQSEIDAVLASFATNEQTTDGTVKDGDTVNIDFVGSVGGVEFEGGNTGGNGEEVTIGVTSYIDNFLEQLIGHKPGDTFDVNVTFPEDYGKENLNGQAAVFVTTINYIVTQVTPELTDAFVADKMPAQLGWKTAGDMRDGIYNDLQKSAIFNYIQEYIINETTVKSMPDKLVEHLNNVMLKESREYYQNYANSYGMALEEFLKLYAGISSLEELVESNADHTMRSAEFHLIIQAIAEDAKITVSNDNVKEYFIEEAGSDDYSQYEEEYGMPYIKQTILTEKVMKYISENSVLE